MKRTGTTAFLVELVDELDPATGTWRAVAKLPAGRHGIGVAVHAGRIWVVGGASVPMAAHAARLSSFRLD